MTGKPAERGISSKSTPTWLNTSGCSITSVFFRLTSSWEVEAGGNWQRRASALTVRNRQNSR